MKSLKQSALVLAIAGLPLSGYAELKPLHDADMGQITGQAGVTIELETQVTMDEFTYTDEGTLGISDIFIGGADRIDMFEEFTSGRDAIFGTSSTDLIDNIKIELDVADDGDAIINVFPITARPVDFAVRTGAWELRGNGGESTLLADNFSAEGLILQAQATVDTDTDTLNLTTRFAIDELELDVPFMAVGIRDMRITGAGYDPDTPSLLPLFTLVDMDIYKDANAVGTDSLAIDINTFEADMSIGQVLVGGTSIGSVGLDDLAIRNTAMRVYGH
ncbi:DUF6160 family protein [Marinobacter sp.]|uniref:DUF6160 family protein n=1 Tax=Marinobacter sp. TaxID=50741 RepID=UPI00260E1754|nr:DUF6160 family protein [Marinobacter sp.]